MRVRPFFWLLLIATCIGVLVLASNYRPSVPVYIQVHMQGQQLASHDASSLLLDITDSQGLPIDQARVMPSARMTNMNMAALDSHVSALGNGQYKVSMRLLMAGPWAITIHTQARGFAPQERTLFVNVV